MDSTHTCSLEVQTQFFLPVGSDKVTPWDPSSSSALQSSPLLEEASTQVQSLTYMDDIYLVGAPDKMPGVISSLQKNLGSVNLKLNTSKSWATRECMRGLKVNKEPKVMKAPVAIGESIVKIPLNPKTANTVKTAKKKATDTQLELS